MRTVIFTLCLAASLCCLATAWEKISFKSFVARTCRVENGCRRKDPQRRVIGGTTVSPCTYPGVVAVTAFNYVLCEGVYSGGKVVVPTSCSSLLTFVNNDGAADLTVYGGDGTASSVITANTLSSVDNGDGTTSITLATPLDLSACSTSTGATIYDSSMTVDTSTCKVVSYGGNDTITPEYTGVLNQISLISSALLPCCDYILSTLNATDPVGTLDSTSIYTCTTSDGATCGGDEGAPIFCTDTTSGSSVVVGLSTKFGCVSGNTFVSLDLTGGTLTGFSASA